MTTPHMNFDAPKGQKATPSCTFTLGGREWSCRQPEDVPFATFKKLLSDTPKSADVENIDGTKNKTAAAQAAAKRAAEAKESFTRVDDFFASTLVPEQVPDFMAMLADPQMGGVTMGNLQPIMQYVTEHVLNRPTKRPASSQARSRSTRAKSAVA